MNEEMKDLVEELQEIVHKGNKALQKVQQKMNQRRGGYRSNYDGGGYNNNYNGGNMGGGGYGQNMGQMHGSIQWGGGMNQHPGQMDYYPQDPTQVPGSMFYDPRYM